MEKTQREGKRLKIKSDDGITTSFMCPDNMPD